MTRLEGIVAGHCTADDHHEYGAEPEDCVLIDGKEVCLYCLIDVAKPHLMFEGDCIAREEESLRRQREELIGAPEGDPGA
jgi:hypothetical protein